MKAVVYRGPNQVAVEDVPDPKIERPTDAIIKITSTIVIVSIIKANIPILIILRIIIIINFTVT